MIKIIEAKTTEDVNIIKKVFNYKNKNYKVALAVNPNISKDIMKDLLNLKDSSISIALASNSSLDSKIAQEIFESNEFYSLEALSKNSACPTNILDKMKDMDVFYMNLAENPSTNISTLEYIMSAKKDFEYCYDILSDILIKRSDIECINTTRSIKRITKDNA